MPHLIVERIRRVPWVLCPCRPMRRKDAACAYAIEVMDIIGGLIFLIGSVCFHPAVSEDLTVFLAGCALFVIGSFIYFSICTFTLAEAIRENGIATFESCENILYLVGSFIFFVGTVLYYPPEAHHTNMNWIVRSLSLGVYFNLFSPEFEGTVFFIIGSFLFAFAAFVNGLNQRSFDTGSSQLLTATTSLYMAGSLLFVMGSVAFLPDLGCNVQMVTIGAWAFIMGSALYMAGSILSFVRTMRELENPTKVPLGSASDNDKINDI